MLLWLLLFKFNRDFLLMFGNTRSLNLLPLATYSRSNPAEMIFNVLVFVPLGLLLAVNLKRASFWQKLAVICLVSIAVEVVQYVLAVGVADVTDVIMNTAGGAIGLGLYAVNRRQTDEAELDRFVVMGCTVLVVAAGVVLAVIFSQGIGRRPTFRPDMPRIER